MAIGAKPAGARFDCGAHDDDDEEGGQHRLDQEHRTAARPQHRQRIVAVGGERRRRLADDVEQRAGRQRAEALGDDVAERAVGVDASAGDEPERDGRIEMAARDVPDREGERHHGEADRDGDAEDSRRSGRRSEGIEGGAEHRRHEHERADELGCERALIHGVPLRRAGTRIAPVPVEFLGPGRKIVESPAAVAIRTQRNNSSG